MPNNGDDETNASNDEIVTEMEEFRFDTEQGTDLYLRNPEELFSFDVENLENLDVIDVKTTTEEGETIVTDCTINLRNLAIIARELDTTERRLNRWGQSGWNPVIRTREP